MATVEQDDTAAVVYGVVLFESVFRGLVQKTMVTFESAQAADLFALEQGWHDYQVCPLSFLAEHPPPLNTPAAEHARSTRCAARGVR